MKSQPGTVRAIAALGALCIITAGCAGAQSPSSNARPGDHVLNRESAPLCQLYPGNYPQSAECMISPR